MHVAFLVSKPKGWDVQVFRRDACTHNFCGRKDQVRLAGEHRWGGVAIRALRVQRRRSHFDGIYQWQNKRTADRPNYIDYVSCV